jgi:hypothetical protein
MATPTIFKRHIGGATERKGQPEWMADGPSVGWFPDQRKIGMFLICSVPMVCPIPGKEAPALAPAQFVSG